MAEITVYSRAIPVDKSISRTGLYTDTLLKYTTTFQQWKPFNLSSTKEKEVLRVTLLLGMKKARRAFPITFCSTQLRRGAKLRYLTTQSTTPCTRMAMINLCLIIMRFVLLAVLVINMPTWSSNFVFSFCQSPRRTRSNDHMVRCDWRISIHIVILGRTRQNYPIRGRLVKLSFY